MKLLVLDNSVAITGAFLSALAMADALRDDASFLFVLPAGSLCEVMVTDAGHASASLPMTEIGRSVTRVLAYVPMLLWNGFHFRRTLDRNNIDVLIANDYFNQLPTVARLFGWRGRIVTIVRLLPANQHAVLNRFWIASMRWTSDCIIAVSQAVKRQLPPDIRTELVYFPVGRGLEEVPYKAPTPSEGNASVNFLFLANYIQGKGQQHALEAFAKLHRQLPNVRLRFIGGDMGLAKNALYRAFLVERAHELGISHVTNFLDGRNDVVGEIQAADVVLNFSESESFSHTCVEAGLLGRPIIATRCGGPEEIVQHDVTGLLVDRQDVVAMHAAMHRLGRDGSARRQMGEAAFDWTRRRFGSAAFADTMQGLLSR